MPPADQVGPPARRIPALSPAFVSRVVQSKWLFAAALICTLTGSWWAETINLSLPLSGGPDEGVYLGAARLLNHGYAFNSFFFDQFALFPQILALALRLGGDSVLTGRLAITLFSALGLLGIALLARSMSTRPFVEPRRRVPGLIPALRCPWPAVPQIARDLRRQRRIRQGGRKGEGARAAALLAMLFTAANSYYLEQSRFAMAQVPGIALMIWALVAVSVYLQRRQRGWLVVSAAACTAGLLIKPLTIGLALPIAWWLIAGHVLKQEKRYGIRWRALALDLLIFAGVGLLTAAVFVNLSDLRGEFQRTVGFHLRETRLFAPQLNERFAGLVSFLTENQGWLGIGLLGAIVAAFKTPGRALPLLLAEGATVLVLAQLSPFRHYYAILVPPLAVFSAIGVYEGLAALYASLNLVRGFALENSTTVTGGRRNLLRPLRLGLWREIRQGRAGSVSILLSTAFLVALAMWMADAPELVRHGYDVLTKTSHDTSATVLFLKLHTTPGDFLISDDPMVVFRADCLIPPSAINLSYPSTFQFFAESGQRLEESVRDYNVKTFVVLGPYRADPKLMQWIAANYPIKRPVFDKVGGESSQTFWRE